MRRILNTVPTGLLVVAVVSLSFGGVVLAVWLIRRYVPATREEFNSEIVAAMLGVLAAFFGLLLAFVVVIQFQNHDDARANVETEADALAAIVRDNQALGGGPRPIGFAAPSRPTSKRSSRTSGPGYTPPARKAPAPPPRWTACTKPFKASSREPSGRGPFTTTRSGS